MNAMTMMMVTDFLAPENYRKIKIKFVLMLTECEFKVCDDPVNEVYQKCGGKCVLGCRYAATSAGISLTISKHECEENDCVEGCFCKMGLVR